MSSSVLARRYALALVSLGKEQNAISEISASLIYFDHALNESDRLLYNTLINPAISLEEKKAVVQDVAKVLGMHPLATNTILLLLDNARIPAFSHMIIAYKKMADDILNIVRAHVTTATDIGEEQKQELIQTLSKTHSVPQENLFVEFHTDADIIGGLIAKVGDRTYDGSIRSQLKDLQQILK